MRKPDDDLKIDISDIFGGDVSQAKKAAEESSSENVRQAETGPAVSAPSVPHEAEKDSRFQEWFAARERELELKTQELEKRIQELSAHPALNAVPAAPPENPQVSRLVSPPIAEDIPVSAPAGPDSPIDFSAPILPPFVKAAPQAKPAAQAGGGEKLAQGTTDFPKDEAQRLQEEYEFLMFYDEFRAIIIHELTDLVGEKKTFTMLERTVELAREKYPEIFRNVNWDSKGNLLADGSIDSQRVVENKSTLDFSKADAVVDVSLSTLLNLRLQAIEKGLGPGLKNKVRARLYQWINEKIEKNRDAQKAKYLKRLRSYVL